jgi:Castor and Pollux, part of voltage-gated ion channel
MHSYAEVRRSFGDAVVCGFLREASDGQTDDELHLNPDDDAVLREGDRLIALASTGARNPSIYPPVWKALQVDFGLRGFAPHSSQSYV